MNNDFQTNLLCVILECGYADIDLLKDCEYDYEDIIEKIKSEGMELNFNNFVMVMFERGKADLQYAIEDRIEELKNQDIEDLTKEETQELKDIKQLDVWQDVEEFYNYQDTHVYIKNNESTYKKYFQEALDTFTNNTGWNFE